MPGCKKTGDFDAANGAQFEQPAQPADGLPVDLDGRPRCLIRRAGRHVESRIVIDPAFNPEMQGGLGHWLVGRQGELLADGQQFVRLGIGAVGWPDPLRPVQRVKLILCSGWMEIQRASFKFVVGFIVFTIVGHELNVADISSTRPSYQPYFQRQRQKPGPEIGTHETREITRQHHGDSEVKLWVGTDRRAVCRRRTEGNRENGERESFWSIPAPFGPTVHGCGNDTGGSAGRCYLFARCAFSGSPQYPACNHHWQRRSGKGSSSCIRRKSSCR